jgi:MFS family permease
MPKNTLPSVILEKKVRRSLIYSILDGSFWSIMAGTAESYFSALAVFLKATPFQLGLISSVPLLIGSFLQIFSNKAFEIFKSKKKIVTLSAFIQGVICLAISYFIYISNHESIIWYIFSLIVMYYATGMFSAPLWSVWMADLVELDIRGKYFANRNKITGLFFFASFVIAGVLLDHYEINAGSAKLAFVILFAIAFAARLISSLFLSLKYEPHNHIISINSSFIDFIKDLTATNAGKVMLYLAITNFGMYIAVPFWAAYMIEDLHFSYMQYMIVNALSLLVKFIAMPLWGKLSDRHGSFKTLSLAGYFMPLLPIMWLFSTDFYYITGIHLFIGVILAGYELISFTILLETIQEEKRVSYISYYNTVNAVMIVLGSFLGSFIYQYNDLFWSPMILVIIVSAFVRLIASSFILPKLKEYRKVSPISFKKLFFKLFSQIPPTTLFHTSLINNFFTFIRPTNVASFVGNTPKAIIKGVEMAPGALINTITKGPRILIREISDVPSNIYGSLDNAIPKRRKKASNLKTK